MFLHFAKSGCWTILRQSKIRCQFCFFLRRNCTRLYMKTIVQRTDQTSHRDRSRATWKQNSSLVESVVPSQQTSIDLLVVIPSPSLSHFSKKIARFNITQNFGVLLPRIFLTTMMSAIKLQLLDCLWLSDSLSYMP